MSVFLWQKNSVKRPFKVNFLMTCLIYPFWGKFEYFLCILPPVYWSKRSEKKSAARRMILEGPISQFRLQCDDEYFTTQNKSPQYVAMDFSQCYDTVNFPPSLAPMWSLLLMHWTLPCIQYNWGAISMRGEVLSRINMEKRDSSIRSGHSFHIISIIIFKCTCIYK